MKNYKIKQKHTILDSIPILKHHSYKSGHDAILLSTYCASQYKQATAIRCNKQIRKLVELEYYSSCFAFEISVCYSCKCTKAITLCIDNLEKEDSFFQNTQLVAVPLAIRFVFEL